MVEYDGATFRGRADRTHFQDILARNCAFDVCHLPAASVPGRWNIVRDIELVGSSQWNCSVDTTAFEDVVLNGLKRTGASPLFLWSCVFRRVKLAGRLSGIKINRSIGLGPGSESVQSAWDQAATKFYNETDWALDISEARFAGGVSFEAVPGSKIRRNPETQVLVLRSKLEAVDWKSLEYDGTALDLELSWFLQDSLFDSVVLAARSDPKWVKRDIAVLEMLRHCEIAEAE